MAKDYDDAKWSAEFRHLRQQDKQAAPGFQNLVTAGNRAKVPAVFHRPAVFALTGTIMLVLAVLALNPQNPSAPLSPGVDSATESTGLRLDLAYEMPTDFLLETPWFPLESTTPYFEVSIPTYEYREE